MVIGCIRETKRCREEQTCDEIVSSILIPSSKERLRYWIKNWHKVYLPSLSTKNTGGWMIYKTYQSQSFIFAKGIPRGNEGEIWK